jgi:hypothetical protein
MTTALGEGDYQCSAPETTARPASTLNIVSWRWGNIPHQDRLNLADVDAELKCGGAAQRI